MNNKILSAVLITWIAASWFAWISSASEIDWSSENTMKEFMKFWENWEFKKGKKGFMKGLTDEEKESIKEMTEEERKEFFETKKSEREAERELKKVEREAHNNVIDKLLAWEALTSDEEVLRSEIIELRAERKAERLEKEVQREEFKAIMDKKRSWEDLSEDEEAKLEEFKSEFKWNKWEKKLKRGGGHNYFAK